MLRARKTASQRINSLNLIRNSAQSVAGVRAQLHNSFRRRSSHHAAADVAAIRPKVNDPISIGNHVQVVLNYHHAVAAIDEAVQYTDEFFNIII